MGVPLWYVEEFVIMVVQNCIYIKAPWSDQYTQETMNDILPNFQTTIGLIFFF